jgi:DNA-binding transcriptional ArsR family regulator
MTLESRSRARPASDARSRAREEAGLPPEGSRAPGLGRINPPTLEEVADADSLELAFRALGNETRRAILAILHDLGGKMRPVDIARCFDLPWQAVSRHLRILTDAGLLKCHILDGNRRTYELDHEYLRLVPGRWIRRVATVPTRDELGRPQFHFADDE